MFKDIEDYEKYIKSLTYEQLVDISTHIDRKQYPVRYGLVKELLLIKQRDNPQGTSDNRDMSNKKREETFWFSNGLSFYPVRLLFSFGLAFLILAFSELFGIKGESVLFWMNAFLVAMIFVLPLFLVGVVRKKEDLTIIRDALLFGTAILVLGGLIEAYFEGKEEAINALLLKEPGRVIYFAYMCLVAAVYMSIDYVLNILVKKEH